MNLTHTQSADYQHRLRFPLEPMFCRQPKLRSPLKQALWVALGVAVGWITHTLLSA